MSVKKCWGYLYVITNAINGMMYIGVKRSPERRVHDWYLGSGLRIKRAVAKYGKEFFSLRVLGWATTKKNLGKMEREAIIFYTKKYGKERLYNIAAGGYGGNFEGHSHTEDARKKIGDSSRGRKMSTESVSKRIRSFAGFRHGEETKKLLSEMRKGEKASLAARIAMKQGWHRRKAAGFPGTRIGTTQSTETRKRISAGVKKRFSVLSEESRVNMRKGLARYWASPESREAARQRILALNDRRWGGAKAIESV